MSDLPPTPSPGQHWGPPPPIASARPARWTSLITLVIALAGVAIGFVGWFRPVPHRDQPPPKPTFSDQQVAVAKANVCTAYGKLDRAVGVLNALPKSSDTLVTALNTRQVFDVFSRYLLATLAEEPASPADLAAAVRKDASSLEDAVIDYQDGFSNSDPQMRSVVDTNTEAANTIRQLCK